jgi:hypothetical protein
VNGEKPDQGVSPYSAGGGGVVFEHVYGATLLAPLLTGGPLDLLGDELAVDEVTFQARRTSPVDDFVVTGSTENPAAMQRRIAIAVRHNPTIAPSDEDFVTLVRAFLTALDQKWNEAAEDTWRIGLVVAGPHTGARETAKLTDLARANPDPELFRAAVSAPGTTTGLVRERLDHLDGVVREALTSLAQEENAKVLTWKLLFALRVAQVQLEGDVAPDRTICVDRLRTVSTSTTDAAALFSELTELAGGYAPIAAVVGPAKVRRDLAGRAVLRASLRYGSAREALARLGTRARSRTGTSLASGSTTLEVDRSLLRDELRAAVVASDAEAGMIVTGDPDVGKSSLTIAVVDVLASEGSAVDIFNLRDVPRTTLELEHLLGGALVDVLGTGPLAETRVLVIDGAEAILEGWVNVFSDLLIAARTAGILVVAVTRKDAAAAVTRAFSHDGHAVEPFTVPELVSEERSQVVTAFPSLSRFADDSRASWLLGRPGLVDLVLRADVVNRLPAGALCEAHVLIAVWEGLVRRDELRLDGEPGPDEREQALLALARRAITGEQAEVTNVGALPSLRSDGILLPPGPESAWAGGEQFAGDLMRDFALAWLFLVNGFGTLTTANAPRWAIRATLLTAQARLVNADDVVVRRHELQVALADIARDHGERWADLVDEATLTLGSPDVMTQVWPTLLTDDASGLERCLRLVAQRHTEAGVAEPVVAGPLVDVYLSHASSVQLPSEVRESAEEGVIAYLRGLVRQKSDQSDPVRVAIRERALADGNVQRQVEPLGMLGADLDDRVETVLRSVAETRPHMLDDVVESPASVISMAKHRPELLLYLAEAYYIEKPRADGSPFAYSMMDDGIRRHTKMGLGFPFAASWAGPFWVLLQSLPLETLAFVNRMLDRASYVRAQSPGNLVAAGEPVHPVSVDLPHLGRRDLVGDSHSWSWYRGTGVGPYPCTSALLAVERAVDAWHETAGLSLDVLVYRLLETCNNLPMLGLAIAFLVRHLEEVTTELDQFLVQPMIWELEFGRMVGEQTGFRAQVDDREIHGFDKRPYSFADVATAVTVKAILAGDEARTTELNGLADQLVANATRDNGFVDPSVHVWASALRVSQYEATATDDGRIALQAQEPPEIAAARAPQQAEMALGNDGWRLLNTYGRDEERRPSDLSGLCEDIAVARQIAESPPAGLGRFALDAALAVAATALVAHGDGRVSLSPDDVEWAVSGLIWALKGQGEDELEFSGSFHAPGGDRSSAAALPSLLLPLFNEEREDGFLSGDIEVVQEALHDCVASKSDEVRRTLGMAIREVWGAPCRDLLDGQCRHDIALEVVEKGLRDCRLGPWSGQRRNPLPIVGDLASELATVDGGDILLDRLTGPIVALSSAAISGSCVAERARVLLDVALGAHRRTLIEWSASQYSLRDEGQVPVVKALIDLSAGGLSSSIEDQAFALMDDPAALWSFLRLLAQLATYDKERRGVVFELWPRLSLGIIGQLAGGRALGRDVPSKGAFRRPHAVGALVLRPQLRMSDSDPDTTLAEAAAHWVPLEQVRSIIEAWIPLATGSVEALDDLVGYLRTLPFGEQVDPGLTWVSTIVSNDYERLAGRTFFAATWLMELRRHVHSEEALRILRRLVDGFVNAGDDRFVEIQRAEEDGS